MALSVVIYSFYRSEKNRRCLEKLKRLDNFKKRVVEGIIKSKHWKSDARRRELVLKRRQEEVNCIFLRLVGDGLVMYVAISIASGEASRNYSWSSKCASIW